MSKPCIICAAITGVLPTKANNKAVPITLAEQVEHLPGAPWCAAGIGSNQIVLTEWTVAAGGHARTGLEHNVQLNRERLAP